MYIIRQHYINNISVYSNSIKLSNIENDVTVIVVKIMLKHIENVKQMPSALNIPVQFGLNKTVKKSLSFFMEQY